MWMKAEYCRANQAKFNVAQAFTIRQLYKGYVDLNPTGHATV